MKNEDPESELNKIKKSFTEHSLLFHQQKSASRLSHEFVGRLAYNLQRSQQLYNFQGLSYIILRDYLLARNR